MSTQSNKLARNLQGTPEVRRRKALMRYPTRTLSLIPLHRPKDRMTRHGRTVEVGKAPVHANWTTRPYDSDKVRKAALESGRNVGVRLTAEQLVVDIDPRNGGREGWAKLCHDIGIDDDAFPKVITGSGGWHLYMSKPADVLIRDTLESDEYNGVEFKSLGRQVVAAGSIHPNGKPYRWAKDSPSIRDGLPPVPRPLLKAIKRPPRASVQGGGQISPEQLAKMLSKLDASDFNEHGKWLSVMMAAHHGTQGDGRAEFVDWSTSDPNYAKDAFIIGKRWDSLHAERNDGVTYRTLNKFLRDAGASDAQARPSSEEVAGDFGDDDGADIDFDTPADDMDFDTPALSPEFAMFDGDTHEDGTLRENPGGLDDDSMAALEELNDKYCAVYSGGDYRIMFNERTDVGLKWSSSGVRDFEQFHANRKVQRDMTGMSRNAATLQPLGEAWQTWPGRKTAQGTCFDTKAEAGAIVNGRLNLWSGFAVAPVEGEWSLFERMIRDDLCAENKDLFEYVMKWIAWKFQNPGEIPGVALAFKGGKGTGKTTLGETIASLFGVHGMAVGELDDIIGRFNGHIETKCFIYGDEVTWGGDVKREAAVKKIITDSRADYEFKGQTPFQGVNHVGLVVAGNEKWIAPASMDERRWCVSTVSDAHQVPLDADKNHPRRKYWDALRAQIVPASGQAALLHSMLNKPLGDWKPVYDVPATEGLGEQKLEGLKGADRWWFERLRDGDLPPECIITDAPADEVIESDEWAKHELHVKPAVMVKAFAEWTKAINKHANVSDKGLINELRKFSVEGGAGLKYMRQRCWKVPRLSAARQVMTEKLRFNPFG